MAQKDIYIIKRTPWDYDLLPEYYDLSGEFSRKIAIFKTFDDLEDAVFKMKHLRGSDPESASYEYEIVRM